jgi:hypothetical protein
MYTSFETASSILEDLPKMTRIVNGFEGVLNSTNIASKYVSWEQWCKIDEAEVKQGLGNKPREKLGSIREMIEFRK